MARGIPTVTFANKRPSRFGRSKGLKVLTGDIYLSTTSDFVTSAIEKRFRKRCTNITVDMRSVVEIVYLRGENHLSGLLRVYGAYGEKSGATLTTVRTMIMPAGLSGTFTAFGT